MQKNLFVLATTMATLAAAKNSSAVDLICLPKVENPTTFFDASQLDV